MSGPAIIIDRRRGLRYVASIATIAGRSVTFHGRLQHTDVHGPRLYAPRTRTLPLHQVEVIWQRKEIAA